MSTSKFISTITKSASLKEFTFVVATKFLASKASKYAFSNFLSLQLIGNLPSLISLTFLLPISLSKSTPKTLYKGS